MLVALRAERLATSCTAPAGTRPTSPAPSTLRTNVRSTAAVDDVSVSVPSTTTNDPLAPPWSWRPTDCPGVQPSSHTSYTGEASRRTRARSTVSWTTWGRHNSSASARPVAMSASAATSRRLDDTVPMAGGCGRARADEGVDMEAPVVVRGGRE